jgi:hypothetical protein
MDETPLLTFKAICNFINDLADVFGSKHKPLKLYKRLINQTQIAHDQAIKKHITVFHDFCISNRDAIFTQNPAIINSTQLSYSSRVYIDMRIIFKLADNDSIPVIWKHLLTISALIDPAGNAKNILKKNVDEKKSSVDETQFLSEMITKFENTITPDSNPADAIGAIMQSGMMTDLVNNMQGGKLDLGKLMGAVQNMVFSIEQKAGDDPEAKQAIGMVNNMIGTINSGQQPDMAGMMSMMTSFMGGLKK